MKAGGTEIVCMVNHAKQSHLRWLFIARLEWEEVVGKWGECVKHFGPLLWSQFLTVASGYDSSSCYHLQVPPTSWTGRAPIHLRFADFIQFPHFLVDGKTDCLIINPRESKGRVKFGLGSGGLYQVFTQLENEEKECDRGTIFYPHKAQYHHVVLF